MQVKPRISKRKGYNKDQSEINEVENRRINSRNKRDDITTESIGIRRAIRKYFEELPAYNFKDLD